MPYKKHLQKFIYLIVISCLFYAGGRLYFFLTDGFTIGNISSTFSYNSEWEARPLAVEEKQQLGTILAQKFYYLGKGCQSYVFTSEDGEYVLKFFKYQRFQPKFWNRFFAIIPFVDRYLERRAAHKQRKLHNLFRSCRIAFDHLQEETGLIFVHLNKTQDLGIVLTFADKLGFEHQLSLDGMEFIVQKKAVMFCSAIEELMKTGKVEESNQLVQGFIQMVLGEYGRGLADNDHALMQNTGVIGNRPVHIDVGQFVINKAVADPQVHRQELFNKTFKFRQWLEASYPELLSALDQTLHHLIGDEFYSMRPTHLEIKSVSR